MTIHGETIPGTYSVATRIANAWRHIDENIVEQFGLSLIDARIVSREWLDRKFVKCDSVLGRVELKHGDLWTQQCVDRTLRMANHRKSLGLSIAKYDRLPDSDKPL